VENEIFIGVFAKKNINLFLVIFCCQKIIYLRRFFVPRIKKAIESHEISCSGIL
jgi:hypothetical protein